MKRTWIVSGIWERTGEPGSATLVADTRAELEALAKARGLTIVEAMSCGGPDPTPAAGHKPHAVPPRSTSAPKAKPPPPPVASNEAEEDEDAAPTPPAPKARRLSPARRAALAVEPGDRRWADRLGFAFLSLGLLAIVIGALLTRWPDEVGIWTGELVQFGGFVLIGIGLWLLAG